MDVFELEQKILKCNKAYYTENKQIVSDYEYDSMIERLSKMSPKSPVLETVGFEPTYGVKKNHPILMGSLEKVNNLEDLKKWTLDKSKFLYASQKIDGLALRLTYKCRKLVEAVTRGNGKIGVDVTQNALEIADIPQYLPEFIDMEHDDVLHITGEVYMEKSSFSNLEKDGFEYSNPRNASSGILMSKESDMMKKANLRFFSYGCSYEVVDGVTNEKHVFDTELHKARFLESLGFYAVEMAEINNFEDLEDYIERNSKNRELLNYGIDGLVIGVMSVEESDSLGVKSEKYPNGKIAYKFKAEKTTTTIKNIEWQIGRSGKVTPVAVLEPIELDGSVVGKATLHNYKNFKDFDFIKGDEVVIEKAGDIIPQIVEKVDQGNITQEYYDKNKFEEIVFCPCCSSELRLSESEVDLYCVNSDCADVVKQKLVYYVETIGIKEVGSATIDFFMSKGIKRPHELYNINPQDLIDEFGEKVGTKVYTNLMSVYAEVDLDVLIASMGISGVGKTVSKLLVKEFGDFTSIVQSSRYSRYLECIDGIGSQTAKNISQNFRTTSEIYQTMIELLEILNVTNPFESIGDKLQGKVFVLTGTMSRKRSIIKSEIEQNGGTVSSSVTKKTNYLVNNDTTSKSSKNKKAVDLGIPIISEIELEEMING